MASFHAPFTPGNWLFFTGKWGDWFGKCRLLLAILLTGRLLAAYQFLSHTV
ncbi:MAG: hypothetical protein H6651_20655 [Ardenticatenales bacterium]|nr:hypothetical protein [Ardenticatenales bacterium]